MKAADVRRQIHSRVAEWVPSLGGRRFLLTVGSGLMNVLLLLIGKISQETYLTITLATTAVYIGANTYQKSKGVPDEPK